YGTGMLSLAGESVIPPDTASAESMARARLRRLSEGFVTARIDLLGDPRAVPGATVKLEGFDKAVSGTYRIDKARHVFSRHGYFTEIRGSRIAKPEPPRAPARPVRWESPAAA